MNILVTGGGGFLGTAIVKLLLARGHGVSVFGRSRYPHLEKMGVPCLQGDIRRREQVLAQVHSGFDAVVHSAAIVGMWGRWSDFQQTNVEGCRHIIEACRAHGIKTLVHTSSPSAVFGVDSLEGVNEDCPYPKKFISHYARSKRMAEELVLGSHQLDSLHTLSLRPHLIMGPGDPNLLPRIVARARAGRLVILGNGHNKVDVVHVDNAALAHLCALERLESAPDKVGGHAYFIGQEKPVELWPFINQVLSYAQIPPVKKHLPAGVAYVAGALLERAYSMAGIYDREPPMTRFLAKQLSCSHYFDHHRAQELLGLKLVKNLEELHQDLRQSMN